MKNKRQEWRQNRKLHRDDGPARIWASGTQEWFQNGNLHRLDGPARIWATGHQEWWRNGRLLGYGETGFWEFWESLNEEQRENAELLKHFASCQ